MLQPSNHLFLNGLTELTPETARALTKGRSVMGLQLQGLKTLTPEVAETLVQCPGWLPILNNVATLTPETAQALAASPGAIQMSGLQAPSQEVLNILARGGTVLFELSNLTTISSPEAAAGLVARAEKVHGGVLHLPAVAELSPTVAEGLAKMQKSVVLPGVGKRDCSLLLPAVAEMSPETAEQLAKFEGSLVLPGITAFESPDSVAVAAALAGKQGPLVLANLKKISPKTLSALIQKEDVQIPLVDTLELIREPDGSPTEDFLVPDGFLERQKSPQPR
jgi:hypothetical protein